MKKKNKIAFLLISLLMITPYLSANTLLLLDSHSAESIALADSPISVNGNLDLMTSNPSSLANLRAVSIGLSYLSLIENTHFFSFSSGIPFIIKNKHYGTVGLDASFFAMKPFANFDETGNRLESINSSDFLITLGYGYPILSQFECGLNFKVISSRLSDNRKNSFAFDIGFLFYQNVSAIKNSNLKKNLFFGLSIQNIGFSQTFISSKSSLPFKVRLNTGYIFFKNAKVDCALSTEINYTLYQKVKWNAGFELGLWEMVKLRIGGKITGDTALRFTSGIGISNEFKNIKVSFNYSFIPMIDLGIGHALSFRIDFGKKE